MFHGLSRTTLNILIIGCLLFIAGVHLLTRQNDQGPLPALTLPPLPQDHWQHWQNVGGVRVSWQARASDELHIRILREGSEQTDITLPVSDWGRTLVTQWPEPEHDSAASLIVTGPLDDTELRNIAAFVIRHQRLVAAEPASYACQLAHPAGAHWWNQQQQRSWAMPALLTSDDASAGLPQSRDDWASFRETAARQLRRDLFDQQRSIDIYARVTYHQWPGDYLARLYSDLGQAQMTAPEAFADCWQGMAEQQSDTEFDQQNTASVTHHRRAIPLPSS